MPKKMMSCVKKVQRSGKSKSSAYGICSSSTGWTKKKGGGWKNKKTGASYKGK
jgi:hypothetical protein